MKTWSLFRPTGRKSARRGLLPALAMLVLPLIGFTTAAEAQLPPSDLAVVSVCATDSLKNCSHIVFTNQPWHILFVVRNVGQKAVDHWSYDITLHGPLGSFPIKTQVDGPPVAVGGATTINWPSPYIFASDQKGDWQIEVVAKIKDATNPDGNPNDNRANATFVVVNKPTLPPSDIAVDSVCAADSTKSCSSTIYTNQPWHILFTVRNTGQKPIDNWSFDISLTNGLAHLVLKTQVAGGPLAVGSVQTINWPAPYTFDPTQQGTWTVSVDTKIKDPTNRDADSTNNVGSATFTVANKGTSPVSDLAVQSVCTTDSSKQCSTIVYTNQPWHVLFSVSNLGNKVIDNWSYDILLAGAGGQVTPLKTQIPGPPIPPGTAGNQYINWSSPTVFGSDQKGLWTVFVSAKVKDPGNPDANPSNNSLADTFVVANKSTNPVSDLAVQFACATDSSKQCTHVVYTNQPWHVLFAVANAGNKVIDNWSYDILLLSSSGAVTPLKTQVAGPPVFPGATPVTINWSSPQLFSSDQKGHWQIIVQAKVKDPTNPDTSPANDSASTTISVLNKGGGQPSDIAIRTGCVTLADSARAPQGPGLCVPFNDQASFRAYNRGHGKVPKGIETFEEAVIALGGKNCYPGPLGPTPNPPAFPNGLSERNLIIQDNVTPTPDPPFTNPSGDSCALYVVGPGFIGANSAKVGEDLFLQNRPASLDLIFTEPNHTGVGFKLSHFPGRPAAGWHITVYNTAGAITGTFEVADSVVQEPNKSFFGVWCNETIGRINIFDRSPQPAPDAVDDIEMWTEPGILKVCTDTLFTGQPWHTDFTVANEGLKPIDNWSFDIVLYGPAGQVIPIKTQVAGQPLPVGAILPLNWESPYIFATDQKGPWRAVVTVKIKDASNPDSDPTDNQIGIPFVVINKPSGETTDLGIGYACVTDSSKSCSTIVYTNQPWHTLFQVVNNGNKPVDNWSYDIVLHHGLGTPPFPLKTQIPGPPIPTGGVITINWPSPHLFTSDVKGLWTLTLAIKVKDPTNPDANPTNNQITISFEVRSKEPQVSNLAIPVACVTDSSKHCTQVVYTNQPWHLLFVTTNLGNKVIDNWSFDILLQPVGGPAVPLIPLKTQVPGPGIPVAGNITINWSSPHLFTSADKGQWQVIVRAQVKDPTNPDPDSTNNQAVAAFEVVNKVVQVTNIAVPSVCVADSTDSCRTFLFTYQAWNAIFKVVNRGLKTADAWAYDLDLYKVGTVQHIVVKTQVGGPPLPVGAETEIHWPGPIFVPGDEGEWDIVATAKVKDSTNPDSDLGDNQAIYRFRVRSPVTATMLSLFEAAPGDGGLRLRWQFVDPGQVTNVDAQRAPAVTGPWSRIGADRRDESGVTVLVDRGIEAGATYYYRLVATLQDGESQTFGPIMASAKGAITAFALSRISPNPSFGSTRIEFAVPRESNIRLSVMDLQGREVAVLADGPSHPGVLHATWNGRTFRGDAPAGLYFINLRTPEGSIVRRLALTK